MAAKFELKKAADDQFMFNLKAGNGEIILTSESYKAKASALNGIESVRTNSKIRDHFVTDVAKNGQFYFNLKAGNGEPIGKSELYTSKAGMENGISSIMENAPKAEIDDKTL
jgi:uncharacterized protein YegP (UPF0339 family)